jgi:hypothetical protein
MLRLSSSPTATATAATTSGAAPPAMNDTVIAYRIGVEPMSDVAVDCAAVNTAPTAPRAVPSTKTTRYTARGLIPMARLSRWLTRTALIIRPSLV